MDSLPKKGHSKISSLEITDLKDQGLLISKSGIHTALAISTDLQQKSGSISSNGKEICRWHYNEKIEKYVGYHEHHSYPHGKKRILAKTPEEIQMYIMFRINRFEKKS